MTGIVAQNVGRTSGLIKSAGGGGGAWTLIKTLTASSSATLSFVDGASDVTLDSTYPIYLFKFINIHIETDNRNLMMNMSIDGGSNYNVTKTTTFFEGGYHAEDDSDAGISYEASLDLAQATGYATIAPNVGNGNDESVSGYMHLFAPSDTTFVKHFIVEANEYYNVNFSIKCFTAGYGNTTSAVDAIQFKMSSGNIDAGTIKLYGIKDS